MTGLRPLNPAGPVSPAGGSRPPLVQNRRSLAGPNPEHRDATNQSHDCHLRARAERAAPSWLLSRFSPRLAFRPKRAQTQTQAENAREEKGGPTQKKPSVSLSPRVEML